MCHLQHIKWPVAVRRPFILSLYGVPGVLIEYSAHNCRYCDFRHSATLIKVILGHFVTLRINKSKEWAICNTSNGLWQLEDHLYWVYRYIYGVSGVLIEYAAHNCRYFDFRPSETIILVILRYFFTLRTQNPRNGPSATPKTVYGS